MMPTAGQAGRLDKRVVASAEATELYLTFLAGAGASPGEQAEEMYSSVADSVRAAGARILQERAFATAEAMGAVAAARAGAWRDLDDGVAPTRLICPPGPHGSTVALQVHAVRNPAGRTEVLGLAGRPLGRMLTTSDRRHIVLSGLSAVQAGPPATQVHAVFQAADRLLRQAGGDMRAVVRTWLWLSDILSWYGEFNSVRSRFFAEHGLMEGRSAWGGLPASTGIGVRPAGGTCGLDVLAVLGGGEPARFFNADGKQGSPHEYGSAFSRAVAAAAPSGARTLYVSGTAAIDGAGVSRHPGDPAGQIEMTLANVRAVLDNHRCREEHVVQAIAYCKTVEVERLWRSGWGDLLDRWPCVTVIADICRPELVFELELTACPGATRV